MKTGKGGKILNAAKEILLRLMDELPESQIPEVIDFVGYLKMKRDSELFRDLEALSESSMDFWDNEIDDEVWNHV